MHPTILQAKKTNVLTYTYEARSKRFASQYVRLQNFSKFIHQ